MEAGCADRGSSFRLGLCPAETTKDGMHATEVTDGQSESGTGGDGQWKLCYRLAVG